MEWWTPGLLFSLWGNCIWEYWASCYDEVHNPFLYTHTQMLAFLWQHELAVRKRSYLRGQHALLRARRISFSPCTRVGWGVPTIEGAEMRIGETQGERGEKRKKWNNKIRESGRETEMRQKRGTNAAMTKRKHIKERGILDWHNCGCLGKKALMCDVWNTWGLVVRKKVFTAGTVQMASRQTIKHGCWLKMRSK